MKRFPRGIVFRRLGRKPSPGKPSPKAAGPSIATIAAKLLLVSVGLLALVLLVDPAVHQAARAAHPMVREAFHAITDLGRPGWMLWVSGIAIVVPGILFRREMRRKLSALYQHLIGAFAFLFAAVALSNLAVNALKLIVGRARPKFFDTHGSHHFSPFAGSSDYFSFPSGHAATAFAAAIVAGSLWPWLRPGFLGVAALIAISRVMTGKHYLADILAGALIGILVALAISRWFEARRIVFSPLPDGRRRVKGARLVRHGWRRLGEAAGNRWLLHFRRQG